MDDTKKKVSAKPVAKAVVAKAADTKTTEVKATVVPAAEVKKEEPVKAVIKEEPKKAVTEKKAAVKETVQLEFAGKAYTTEDLVRIAKDVWKYDLSQKEADFKKVELYVKPEESKVYYVINDTVTGDFAI